MLSVNEKNKQETDVGAMTAAYDSKDSGEEKQIVGEDWCKVEAFISTRRHG